MQSKLNLLPTRKFSRALTPRPLWVGYSFALSASALAIVAELYYDRVTGQQIPFVIGFGAVIASAAWAGAGPGLLSTLVLAVWAAFFDLQRPALGFYSWFTRCAVFSAEGIFLSLGSARMWRFAREAAESEGWHRRLVETAAEGIWILDPAGVVIWANERLADLLGVSLEQMAGRSADDFFFPADVWSDRTRRESLRPGVPEQFDRRLRRADGNEIWVLASCNRIPSTPDEPGSVLDMMTDITERRRAEAALRKSEQRFRSLFEGVLEGVYQSSPDGRIIAANPMLLDMLGLKNEADLNAADAARDLYVDPAGRKKLLEKLEREGGIQNAEYEMRRVDGSVITVLENARVVRGEDGSLLYCEGTLTDITDRKRMEEQLRQAQKTEALGRLAGGIAHDFSNVLTVIGGYAKLAVSELPVSHPARASAGQVVEATESAMALTRQLLSFSQRSARPETTDLNRVLRRAESSLAAAGSAELVLSLSAEPALVHARGSEIEEIAAGLIGAVAAGTRQGTGVSPVEVRTVVLNMGAEFARLYPDIQPGLYAALCIFGSPAPAVESPRDCLLNGLVRPLSGNEGDVPGLLRARETVTNLGGFLAAGPSRGRSEAGPIGIHAFLPCIAVPGATHAGSGETKAAGGETILLVEDEPLVRELSRDMLERQGYRVILAADALEAERISVRPPGFDLLITDAVMPAMTGPELARRLRASHPGLKVLYIAGYADPALRHDDMAVSGSSQIEKPFSADALGRKVRQMLDRS